jgi:translocation and assembly module TamA
MSLAYSITPYQSLFFGNQQFAKQRLTGNFYLPIDPNRRIVLALRMQFGSIAGTAQSHVPLTKLFLGGSEDNLRGYRYKTVSPLNDDNEPLGGRSAIFATIETRFKVTKSIGIVPFADFGTVGFSSFPQLNQKWLKSVGAGFRYFAFFGPLRFDIGFPLNKRKDVDQNFQIYASVGQAF